MKKNNGCGSCANCMTRDRWEATYIKYLKDNGETKSNLDFVKRQRKLDLLLLCFESKEFKEYQALETEREYIHLNDKFI